MRLPKLITVLSAVTGVLAQKAPLRRRDDNPAPETAGNRTTVAPKRFILEFAQVSLEKHFESRNSLFITSQGTNAEAAAAEVANVRGAKILRVFQSDIFSGVAVESEDENIDTLESIEPVSRAWQSKRIKLAPGAPSKSFSEEATAFNYSIHHMTGVDKLHAAGILGKGAKVAIVDTGVYYTHPAVSLSPTCELSKLKLFSWAVALALASKLLVDMIWLAMEVCIQLLVIMCVC